MCNEKNCPCGRKISYEECCKRYHSGLEIPDTAESLMRARFSAFVKRNIVFLRDTYLRRNQPEQYKRELLETFRATEWKSLNILHIEDGLSHHQKGCVEFTASYLENDEKGIAWRSGRGGMMHEISFFKKEGGKWWYSHGLLEPEKKPSKNQPCWCGSGLKYKRCHGRL